MFGLLPTSEIGKAAVQLTITLQKVDLLIDDVRIILAHVNAIVADVHVVMDRIKGQPSALQREGEDNGTIGS